MNARVKWSLAAASLAAIVGGGVWVFAGLADFDPNEGPVGYVGMPAVSSNILYTGTTAANRTRLYAIDYDATDWSGNLHSYPLSAAGAVVKIDDWTGGAAARTDVQNPNLNNGSVATGRKIVSRTDAGTNIRFQWGSLSANQQNRIDSANKGKASSPVFSYLRGDRTNEGTVVGKYRVRSTVLGDMIHSTPVYCDAADCGAATVFVGANDGMLHAFNAATDPATAGSERFAYVPSMLIGDSTTAASGSPLAQLTSQTWTHTYFVDGRMDIRKFGSKTILVGALGRGGRGLFALDVTNAAPASEDDARGKILWEITNATTGFSRLGYTYGQPVLTTLPDGSIAAVVNNGYNNAGDGTASLYLIRMNASGALGTVTEITTSTGSTASRNGLSSPTLVDTNVDGKAEYAYAGDLDGNLWKFDLTAYTATKLHTVSPAQSITMAPGLFEHPDGGFVVTFVTGRMLAAADASDPARHYAYGIWDAAPSGNTTLFSQTLTEHLWSSAPGIRVRTAAPATAGTTIDWSPGHHKGWQTQLPIDGERVVGDGAFVTGAIFMFLSTNPTVPSPGPPAPSGENWWMQLNALTGGDNGAIRFDLNGDSSFTSADQVTVDGNLASPVGRNMGGGVRSQLTALDAKTFQVYQANYDKNSGEVATLDRGVSGGHFDYDVYYGQAGTSYAVPTGTEEDGNSPFCLKTTDVGNEVGNVSPTYCTAAKGYPTNPAHDYMTKYTTGAKCGTDKAGTNLQTIYCSPHRTETSANTSYANAKHVHEYDDIYDVTGVNMLAASDSLFNLPNAYTTTFTAGTAFKILVMNQYLNPAALLATSKTTTLPTESPPYVSIKAYGSLASQTDAAALLQGLETFTGATIKSFVFNLPLNAFKSRDWWGDGGTARAGLIPTQTGCVNKVNADGSMVNNTSKAQGLIGKYGERYDGALTIQLIKADTPASALEPNAVVSGVPDYRYGWRVTAAQINNYVLAEYTTFWHHPNGLCYGASSWVPNPAEDNTSDAKAGTPAVGSSDPKGTFGGTGGTLPPTVVRVVSNPDGSVTVTYSDNTVVITYADGSSKTTLPNGTVAWTIPGIDTGGVVNLEGIDTGGVTTPPEVLGRINWREPRR